MKLNVIILTVAILFSTSLFASEDLVGQENGQISATFICAPELNIIIPNGIDKTVNLGYFFPGTTTDVDLSTQDKIIKWMITGPKKGQSGENINYLVSVTNDNFFNDYFSVTAEWIFQTELGTRPTAGGFKNAPIKLVTSGLETDCTNYAYLTVKALHLYVYPGTQAGTQLLIGITVNVTATI